MILHSLALPAFRGMKNVDLGSLAPVSIIFGANNAGKSSCLEAAALLLRPFDPSQWVNVARQRDLDLSLVDALWSLFPSSTSLEVDDGPKQTSGLVVSGLVDQRERKLDAYSLASSSFDSDEEEDLTLQVRAKVTEGLDPPLKHNLEFRRDVRASFNRKVEAYRAFAVTPATHRSNRSLVDHLSAAIDVGKKSLAIELLKMFDDEVEELDISVTRGREAVRVTHRSRGIVDLASFGDGMRRAATLALALVRSHQGLLLVDEIEAGIHKSILPRVLQQFVEAAERAEVQILATTHSLEAIDSLCLALPKNSPALAGFYIQRTAGSHSVRRYSLEQLLELRHEGVDLR